MRIGLRIDVDTFRGTRDGVPALCSLLADHDIKASFFFSVGPDNMGRHIWRLLRSPAFMLKMVRSNAASLYGWDILIRGTFWPGPIIGDKLHSIIRSTNDAGHEVGLHAWDHHAWQAHIDRMDENAICRSLTNAFESLEKINGHAPLSSAVPGWKCNNKVLAEKSKLNFQYNSDCRGQSIFYPIAEKEPLSQPQIPVTLPTYDEVIGQTGITSDNYNDFMLSLLKPGNLNVLTVHAEVEGISTREMFSTFLKKAIARHWSFVPLIELLPDNEQIDSARIAQTTIPGREGWVSVQDTGLRGQTWGNQGLSAQTF